MDKKTLKDELTKILNSCLELVDVLNLNKHISINLLKSDDNNEYKNYYLLFASNYGVKAYFADAYASFELLEQALKDKIEYVFKKVMLKAATKH